MQLGVLFFLIRARQAGATLLQLFCLLIYKLSSFVGTVDTKYFDCIHYDHGVSVAL